MVGDTLQPFPHINPSVFWYLPELTDQKIRFKCIFDGEEEGKFTVINLILEWEFNAIADNDWHTVADYSIKQTAR